MADILASIGVNAGGSPAITPALLAYFRGLGISMDELDGQVAAVRTSATNRAAASKEATGEQYHRAERNTVASLASRGVLSSGEAGTKFGELQSDRLRAFDTIDRGAADEVAGAESSVAGQRDALRRTALERYLGADTDYRNEQARTAAEQRAAEKEREYWDRLYQQQEQEAARAAAAPAAPAAPAQAAPPPAAGRPAPPQTIYALPGGGWTADKAVFDRANALAVAAARPPVWTGQGNPAVNQTPSWNGQGNPAVNQAPGWKPPLAPMKLDPRLAPVSSLSTSKLGNAYLNPTIGFGPAKPTKTTTRRF